MTVFTFELLLRILAAAGLGALIGLERDVHGRAAGLRTHLLVTVGSAVFTILSEIVARDLAGSGELVADPGRIAAQIITGIGFLGAGVIIKEGRTVRGLTTAACLWVAASIGMACGTREYTVAVATTVLTLISLVLLKILERQLVRDSYRTLTVVTRKCFDVQKLVGVVQRANLKINQVSFDHDFESGQTTTRLALRLRHHGLTDRFAEELVSSLEQAQIPLVRVQWGAEG